MFLAQRCGLTSVVTSLVPLLDAKFHTLRSRLQEFYQPADAKSGRRRAELDVTTCFAPLLAWLLRGWRSNRIAVAIDATSLGDRFTVLSLGVVFRGEAIPVARKVLPANFRHSWKPEWLALVRAFAAMVPPRFTVIVMTDRALYARWFYREIQALGWHPLMRITKVEQIPQAGVEARCGGQGAGSKAGVPVGRPRLGLPHALRAAAGVHALGLLGGGLRGAMILGDRPGAEPGAGAVVRDEFVDRGGATSC